MKRKSTLTLVKGSKYKCERPDILDEAGRPRRDPAELYEYGMPVYLADGRVFESRSAFSIFRGRSPSALGQMMKAHPDWTIDDVEQRWMELDEKRWRKALGQKDTGKFLR